MAFSESLDVLDLRLRLELGFCGVVCELGQETYQYSNYQQIVAPPSFPPIPILLSY